MRAFGRRQAQLVRRVRVARGLWLVAAMLGAVSLAACGAVADAGVSPSGTRTQAVTASCVGLTPAQQFKAAHVVFEGTMLSGPTARVGGQRALRSPARIRVIGYVKGHGPAVVRVDTGSAAGGGGIVISEDGIEPVAGQDWRIYSDSSRQPFTTSICAGSRLLRASRAVPVTNGEDLPHAYLKLHDAGLSVTFTRPFSLDWSYECVPLVAGSVPGADAAVTRGSAVSLLLRIPPCGVASPGVPVGKLPSYRAPDFIGKPLTAAIAWIQHRNLYWAATIPPLHAGNAASLFANYTITRQRPRPGGAMKLGNEGHDSFQPTPLKLTVKGRPPAGR